MLKRYLALAALPLVGGCMSVGHMRSLPRDLGTEARYSVPLTDVHAALPAAIDRVDATLTVDEPLDSVSRILVASRSMTFFSNGDLTRILLYGAGPTDDTDVRVLSRSRYLLDMSGRAGRMAPRLVAALDQELGPDAVAPHDGMEVRGRATDGTLRNGPIVARADGDWMVAESAPRTVALSELSDVAVLRGSYDHRAEGALVGSLLGFGVGLAIAAGGSGESVDGLDWYFDSIVGAFVGSLAGMAVGAAIRTEVWSPMAGFSRPGDPGRR